MTVLPASRMVDFGTLKEALKARSISLAPEKDLEALFPETETGAIPPFGHFYGLEVVVDDSLALDEHITFNAGTHYEAIRMRYEDFARLVRPHIARFAMPFEQWAA